MAFEKIRFHGTFRDYQQNILNNIKQYLENNKIHIVAAPGSGKTVLGLELIRLVGKPALVFSPTVTIRQQWGERFEEKFLPPDELIDNYFSFDIMKPDLITSVTYQALHAAFNRLKHTDEVPEDTDDDIVQNSEYAQDYSQFDLIAVIKKAGIKTICLDEAHHLRSEWQKTLEAFIKLVESEVTIIALTATPPYDSIPSEWSRYISVCGEIDEEISVPELVAQKTLCPHQDYIYFNYPTAEEAAVLQEYKEKALSCVTEIIEGSLLPMALSASRLITHYQENCELILDNPKGFIALLCVANAASIPLPKKLIRLVCPGNKLPAFHLSFAETAFEFIINNPQIFTTDVSDAYKHTLSSQGLMKKNKVRLVSSDSVNRSLISSMGKLSSITDIVQAETQTMGESLRMLILTDYIKKDLLKHVGTSEQFSSMGIVPVFETIRRNMKAHLGIAVLSGTLVIVPNHLIEIVKSVASSKNIGCSFKPLGSIPYSEVVFDSSNKSKVAVMTEVFQQGHIHVLIGTKSLLGEGWDSPCINSLILASFVGSFMLSNQMRGRAIRIDPKTPGKTANIWHLVTVEPPLLSRRFKTLLWGINALMANKLISEDYSTLVRRFECFLAPSYDGSVIESGISRINVIKPPFNNAGIARINHEMMKLASARHDLSSKWDNALRGSSPEILNVSQAPKDVLPTGFLFYNALSASLINSVWLISLQTFLRLRPSESPLLALVCLVIVAAFVFWGIKAIIRLVSFISPFTTIKTLGNCVLNSLVEIGEISTPGVKLNVISDKSNIQIYSAISNATMHEKNVFAKAIGELLSYIDNPRYILIKRNRFLLFSWKSHYQSYACPCVLSINKKTADIFAKHLKKAAGRFELCYTRSEKGRSELIKCRQRSYINRNQIMIEGKKIVKSKWE